MRRSIDCEYWLGYARAKIQSMSWTPRKALTGPIQRNQAGAKPPKSRGRRRPDPLAAVTELLKASFDADPWKTSPEPLDKLQTEVPEKYPNKLLRKLQRRLKVWRSQRAHLMVFGDSPGNDVAD